MGIAIEIPGVEVQGTLKPENLFDTLAALLSLKFDDLVKIACDHCPHQHEAYVMDWNPKPGAWVLCIMRPDGSGDGYVVGEV